MNSRQIYLESLNKIERQVQLFFSFNNFYSISFLFIKLPKTRIIETSKMSFRPNGEISFTNRFLSRGLLRNYTAFPLGQPRLLTLVTIHFRYITFNPAVNRINIFNQYEMN